MDYLKSDLGSYTENLKQGAGNGHSNDPDMLEVGKVGMTTEEYRQHICLGSMLAAPLLAGKYLSKLSAETREILTNRDVIALDQVTAHRARSDFPPTTLPIIR